jgi:hypothetical protein
VRKAQREGVIFMKVIYTEKGHEFDHKRIDHICTFTALSSFRPDNCGLIYFRIDRFNVKVVPAEDIISIEDCVKNIIDAQQKIGGKAE